MKRTTLAALVAAALAATLATSRGQAQPQPAHQTFVQAGKLLADPATGQVATNKTLVIENGKVVDIKDGFVGDGDVVDLRDSFVLPGLIDTHVHILNQQGPTIAMDLVRNSQSREALNGAMYALRTLRAGFTT